jgi:DNA polymerase III gamma/tau subunit
MKTNWRTSYFVVLALLVAGYFALSPGAAAAAIAAGDSEEVTKLLSSAKAEAHELERDAEELENFTRQNLSWESHAAKTNAIKEHVNTTGQLLTELNGVRETASPWQQAAIDRIEPLLKELADNMELTIEHLNDNQGRLHAAATYKEYAASNYGLAKELTALIDDYMEYGKHKAEFERLEEKLKVAER